MHFCCCCCKGQICVSHTKLQSGLPCFGVASYIGSLLCVWTSSTCRMSVTRDPDQPPEKSCPSLVVLSGCQRFDRAHFCYFTSLSFLLNMTIPCVTHCSSCLCTGRAQLSILSVRLCRDANNRKRAIYSHV